MLFLKMKLISVLFIILSFTAVLSMTEITSKAQTESGIYYVTVSGAGDRDGSSWDNAMSDVQEAIEGAALYATSQGDSAIGEVRIAEGVYHPTGYPNRQAFFTGVRDKHFSLRNKVSVIGGYAGDEERVISTGFERDILVPTGSDTILSGDLGKQGDVTDNSIHVFYHPEGTDLDETAVLMNVIVKEGNAEFHEKYCRCGCGCGGGMYNYHSSPTITDCTFMDNAAVAEGGGIYNLASRSVMTGCTFIRNHANNYGGAVKYGGIMDSSGIVDYDGVISEGQISPLVIGCVFTNNSVGLYGGGIYSRDGNLTVASSRFEDNTAGSWGGGICIRYAKSPRLMDCELINNRSEQYGGGMYVSSSGLTVSGCTFKGNTAALYGGGVLLNSKGILKLKGCNFTDNKAEEQGGGIYNRAWILKAEQCAFNGNMADVGGGIYNETGSLNRDEFTFLDNVAYSQKETNDVAGYSDLILDNDGKEISQYLPSTGDSNQGVWVGMFALPVVFILIILSRRFTGMLW